MKLIRTERVKYEFGMVPQKDDSVHMIYDAGLRAGAELHQFNNCAGVPYSAIYVDGNEEYSCERQYEDDMIREWNEFH